MTTESISDRFSTKMIRFSHSWRWVRRDFEADFRTIEAEEAWREDAGHEVIWRTACKYVLKIALPSGRTVAYKRYTSMRLIPYLHYWSPTSREACNFSRMEQLGLPMVRLLATGGIRTCFLPKSCFLVTAFAEGFRDGRPFMPGRDLEHETALRDEFCRRNFALIARLHDIGWYHRGFTPMNELWRERAEPDAEDNRLELRWIDVATCHWAFGTGLRRRIADDLAQFLQYWDFPPERRAELLHISLAATKVKRFTFEQLSAAVEKALARRLARKKKK